ncbi:MAG: TerB family tellurite resistance protein [Mesonia hippocampi]|uniref:Putative tellurite resistance protein B-like protein n=1 Tax=Mesonia hippocampi TaxID=1628250 RepID=A0A840EQL9_9FLAO|nr:TerB family tellurite resistance protein [Mesonia hippocampi]MBB4119341.1 putative tellurite resistance protein B-like protein [Mesonia hippocampi]
MSFTDLFDSGEHRRNLGHFASIVNLAAIDGEINTDEEKVLKRLAIKLDIDETEYIEIIKNPTKFPINPPNSKQKRLERLYDALTIIFADHDMDEQEALLLKRYAIGLGFSNDDSNNIIKRSIKILGGRLSFDDYLYLLERK